MNGKKELELDSLYELTDPIEVDAIRLRSRLPSDARERKIDFELLSQGRLEIQEPIQFDAAQGSIAEDVLWTQLIRPVCVSNRVTRILTGNAIRGWSTYPVEVYDKEGDLLPNYLGFAVTGAACAADYSLSSVIEKQPPSPRGRSYEVYRGLYFDVDEWDGSDMFWVGGVRVVVQKVRELFEQEGVKNVRFTPLAEREIRIRHVKRD